MKILIVLLVTAATCFSRDLSRMGFSYGKTTSGNYAEQSRAHAVEIAQATQNEFRIVSGKTNRIAGSDWVQFHGKITQVLENGVMITGYFYGLNEDSFAKAEMDFFVYHYPFVAVDDQMVGNTTYLFAKNVGTYTYTTVLGGSRTIRKLDYGKVWTPPPPPPPTAEELAALKSQTIAKTKANVDKALQWNLSQAESGDAYGQFRMGERYLNGEGVERNETKAKEWLKKAADQGHKDAATKLAWVIAHPGGEPIAPTSPK